MLFINNQKYILVKSDDRTNESFLLKYNDKCKILPYFLKQFLGNLNVYNYVYVYVIVYINAKLSLYMGQELGTFFLLIRINYIFKIAAYK